MSVRKNTFDCRYYDVFKIIWVCGKRGALHCHDAGGKALHTGRRNRGPIGCPQAFYGQDIEEAGKGESAFIVEGADGRFCYSQRHLAVPADPPY